MSEFELPGLDQPGPDRTGQSAKECDAARPARDNRAQARRASTPRPLPALPIPISAGRLNVSGRLWRPKTARQQPSLSTKVLCPGSG